MQNMDSRKPSYSELRAQTEENFKRMAQERDRRSLWVNGACVLLAAFTLVAALLLWPVVWTWLHGR